MAKMAEKTSKGKPSLKKEASAKKRDGSSEPRQVKAPAKKKAVSKKPPAKIAATRKSTKAPIANTPSPTKTSAKRKPSKAQVDDTPSPKARKYQQSKSTPETQEETPSTGGSAMSKTSVVRENFREQLKFTNSPAETKGQARGKKAPKKNRADVKSEQQQKEKAPRNTKTKGKARTAATTAAKALKKRAKRPEHIQAHQVDWLTLSGVSNALMVNCPGIDLEGRGYEECVDLLLPNFTPSKISTAYALFGPKCNVLVEDADLDKDFNSKPKAIKMFKDMLMNRHSMILQEKTIEIDSPDDESVEAMTRNR